MADGKDIVDDFATNYYAVVRRVVSEADCIRLFDHAIERSRTETMTPDTRVPNTPAAYSDTQMEALLLGLQPKIEEITGFELYPTYSYFRVYKNGDVLPRHKDRDACEISVSVNLGCVTPFPWPICIEGPKGVNKIEMDAGDAVIYKGIDCPHWREAFRGERAAQVFLHYVDRNGQRADWKFDKRTRIGTVPSGAITISKSVVSMISDDGVLELANGGRVRLDSFRAAVWRDVEARISIPDIADHMARKFALSRSVAEALIMDFVHSYLDGELLCEIPPSTELR